MSALWLALDWIYERFPILLAVWMVINAIGLYDAVFLLRVGIRKRRAGLSRGLRPDGPRVLLANRGIREMVIRLVFHVVGLATGVSVLLDFVPPGTTGWLIISMACLMMSASRFDRSDDIKMGKTLTSEIREHSLISGFGNRRSENATGGPRRAREG
jgi:hypothetical protein